MSSPLKKYGRRDVRAGTDLDTAQFVAKAGDKDVNARRTGQAIGAIGTEIGDAVDSLGKKKEKKPNKTNPAGLAELEKTFKPPVFPPPNLDLPNSVAKIPELLPDPPRPTPSITVPTATSTNDNPYQFGPADSGATPRGDWQGPLTEEASPAGPEVNVPQQDWDATNRAAYNRGNPGPLNVPSFGYDTGGIGTSYGSPVQRNSPLKRTVAGGTDAQTADNLSRVRSTSGQAVGAIGTEIGDSFSYDARPEGEMEQEKTALSYLGEAGQAATEAANRQIKRRNYKREVWDKKRKEADEQFSKINVEPSGVSSYDASVGQMAMEWKKEAADLIRNKHKYDPFEYQAKLGEIEGRSAEYSSAAQNIQQVVADYQNGIDNISPSTPPETIDILDTLAKGGQGLSVQNVNGIPTLAGVTNSGQEVSVPISEIASGKNTFKFNSRIEHEPLINGIVDDAFKFQEHRATQMGVVKTQLGFDELRPRIESKIDGVLKNDYQVRAILADKFGYDYDDYEAMVESGQDPKQFARQLLMEDIQDRMQPKYSADQQTVNAANQQRAINEAQKQQAIEDKKNTPTTAGERSAAQFQEYVAKGPNLVDDESVKYYGNALASKGARIRKNKNGEYFIFKGKQNLGPANKQSIEAYLTGQAPSPVQRRSPLKRFMDWASSPFKREQPPERAEFERALADQDINQLQEWGYNQADIDELERFGTDQYSRDKVRERGHIPGTAVSTYAEEDRLLEWGAQGGNPNSYDTDAEDLYREKKIYPRQRRQAENAELSRKQARMKELGVPEYLGDIGLAGAEAKREAQRSSGYQQQQSRVGSDGLTDAEREIIRQGEARRRAAKKKKQQATNSKFNKTAKKPTPKKKPKPAKKDKVNKYGWSEGDMEYWNNTTTFKPGYKKN